MFTDRPGIAGGAQARQAGISLIELVIFIMIVSIGLAGILGVLNLNTGHSADPLVRKQALAIAESLLEEIELMPSTYCDPDDPNAATAMSTADCSPGQVEVMGPEAGETRYSSPQFDNVNDYNGFSMAGIRDITNTAVTGLEGYSASVAMAQEAVGGVPAADSLHITVTVTAPDASQIVIDGYRMRYAPRTTP